MTLLEFIRSHLSLALISELIEHRTPVTSMIFTRVFERRENRPTPTLNLAEINRATKCMPVIHRGGHAVPLDPHNAAVTWIEPLSIRLSELITGAKLNNLKTLYGTGDEHGQALVSAELDRMVQDLMDSTELTRNALCAQALTGKIDYQMESENGLERYEISFGTDGTSKYTLTTLLDDESATLIDAYNTIIAMRKVLSEAGYSGTIEVMAGSNAYSTLSNLVAVTPESSRLGSTISENHITIFGIPIYANLDTYTDKDSSGAEVVKDCIDKNSLVMYIKGSGKLAYCAIDDLDGNLQATPFFSKVVKLDDPSAYNVISESKPMPLIPPKSVCWATVTASMGRRTALTINNNITVDTGAEQSLQNIEEQNSEEPEKTE